MNQKTNLRILSKVRITDDMLQFLATTTRGPHVPSYLVDRFGITKRQARALLQEWWAGRI